LNSAKSGIRRIMAGLRHDCFDQVDAYMLKAFIDDSGSGGDSTWYVLAGYVGTLEAWDAFEKPWIEILNGSPKLEYFKASEAESLRPNSQWAGISKDARNRRIDSFIDVIRKFATRAFHVRARQKDYDEVIKPYIPKQWDNAYFFLFMGLIASVTSVEKYAGYGQPVDFVFDWAEKKRIQQPSLRLYGQCADLPQFRGRVHNIHYEDEKKFLPLQAADLLAWQIRRRFSVECENRAHFEMALNAPAYLPYEHIVTREDLERYGELMDNNGKSQWSAMGLPEELRPWRRPEK
jgi:hypothetical protein